MITAYSYDYIKTINKKMIDLPMDYTLSSMYELKKFVEFLNNNNVLICDSSAANCLVTEDKLVVIDPDHYEINNKCEEENLKEMNLYLVDLWCEEYGLKSKDDIELISKQFYDKNIDLYLYKMAMKLTEKTPREFITKTLKKNRRT
jgi:tRNA A-37 threonylcarbamoyl transferase component Bud32